MNRASLVGRLTRDPEIRQTTSNKTVCSFSIAVQKRFKTQDAEADFFNCTVWGQGAEYLSKYGAKGRLIAVDGSLNTRKYTKDGQAREVVEINCEYVSLLDKPREEDGYDPFQDE